MREAVEEDDGGRERRWRWWWRGGGKSKGLEGGRRKGKDARRQGEDGWQGGRGEDQGCDVGWLGTEGPEAERREGGRREIRAEGGTW